MALVERYVNTASAGGDGTTNGESGATAAYASMTVWEAAEQTDLVAATDQHKVWDTTGSGSAADSIYTVTGWTTNATYFITIAANTGEEAQMPYDTSRYRVEGSSGSALKVVEILQDYTVVDDIQAKCTVTGNVFGSAFVVGTGSGSASGVRFNRCLGRAHYNNGGDQSSAGRVQVFIVSITGTNDAIHTNCVGITSNDGAGKVYTAQCFAGVHGSRASHWYSCKGIIEDSVVNRSEVWSINPANTAYVVKNCLAGNYSSGGIDTESGFDVAGGSFHADSTNNASTEADAPGTNNRDSQTFTFVNAGTGDYHLDPTDAGARTFGTDLSGDAVYPFSDDFDGVTRPATWDIGAHNVTVAAGGGGLLLLQNNLNGGLQ